MIKYFYTDNEKHLTAKDIMVLPFNICDFDVHQKMFDDILLEFGKVCTIYSRSSR